MKKKKEQEQGYIASMAWPPTTTPGKSYFVENIGTLVRLLGAATEGVSGKIVPAWSLGLRPTEWPDGHFYANTFGILVGVTKTSKEPEAIGLAHTISKFNLIVGIEDRFWQIRPWNVVIIDQGKRKKERE